jgi:hypothetical protein
MNIKGGSIFLRNIGKFHPNIEGVGCAEKLLNFYKVTRNQVSKYGIAESQRSENFKPRNYKSELE